MRKQTMTFRHVIDELYAATASGHVYVMRGYDDGKATIGIRASYYGDQRNDPIIDDMCFMISGKIWNHEKNQQENSMETFINNHRDMFSLSLKANCLDSGVAHVEIDLGRFRILKGEAVAVHDGVVDIVRCEIQRK